MSAQADTQMGGEIADKGKGKAVEEVHEEESSDEEAGDDTMAAEELEEEEDDLAEIDPSNIIGGPRTRGKAIDFAKAAEEAGDMDEDDDEDEEYEEEVADDKMDES